MDSTRDTGAIVGQGGRSLEKGTSFYYDVIMTAVLKLRVVAVLGVVGPGTEIIYGTLV